jgi:hypothetical protein
MRRVTALASGRSEAERGAENQSQRQAVHGRNLAELSTCSAIGAVDADGAECYGAHVSESHASPATRGNVFRVDADFSSKFGVPLRNAELLRDVIDSTPGLTELLAEVIALLQEKFREHATIVLEPFSDPEIADARPRVIVVAVTPLPFARADALLDQVIEEWWTENHHRAEGRVSLATELV